MSLRKRTYLSILATVICLTTNQQGQLPAKGKTTTIEGKFHKERVKAIEGKSHYVVITNDQRYVISPVPTALQKRAGKIDAIRILGSLDEDTRTIEPDKIQVRLEEKWENLQSPDLDEKIICDDKNCRNCQVRCGGTCRCSKWNKK